MGLKDLFKKKKKKAFNPKPKQDRDSHPESFVRVRVLCNFINYKNLVVFDVPKDCTVSYLLDEIGTHFNRDPQFLECRSCEQTVGYFEKTKQEPRAHSNEKKVMSLGPEENLKVEVIEHESI